MTPGRRDEIALRVVSVLVVGSIAWALAALTWRLVGWDDGRSEVAVAEEGWKRGSSARQTRGRTTTTAKAATDAERMRGTP
jgi:hypothetical protein